jgi:ribosomal protein L40E
MSKMMKSIQISNKFYNLSILLLAKEEHKEKFNEWIEYNNCGCEWTERCLKGDIEEIFLRKKWFITTILHKIIEQKYQKYITERKITIPKFDDITEYNPDECCPVCFETFGIDDDDATTAEGANCNHIICRECYMKIATDTNRCPICREKLENTTTDDDTDDDETGTQNTDEDDESDWGDDIDNLIPTSNLYIGRRWFNTQTNRIEYYDGSSWTQENVRLYTMFHFLTRHYGYDITIEERTCCLSCGLQRTREVNDYMDTNNPILQGNYFFFGYCYDCHIISTNLEHHFDTMPFPH